MNSFEKYQAIVKQLDSSKVQVLPVSKGHSQKTIEEFILSSKLQCIEFGENYLDELLQKEQSLAKYKIDWHYLGRLQSRKISQIMSVASVIHGVTRIKELEMIALELKQNNAAQRFRGFYLQLNISGETTKGGFLESQISSAIECVKNLNLEKYFLGFMGMATDCADTNPQKVISEFQFLAKIRDTYAPSKKLNMGMSGDYQLALQVGTNLIRLGTVLFGARV